MIDANEFDVTLRRLVNRGTFAPFFVELDSGQQILVRRPEVAFGGGSASFIDSEDGALVNFSHKQVRGFRPASQEVGA